MLDSGFRAALERIGPLERDAWVDRALGLEGLPDDAPELPRGCVPYLPCPVDALMGAVDQARVLPSDVIVDVGSGLGRAAIVMHLLSGATAIGLEIQGHLAAASRELAARCGVTRFSVIEGDAVELVRSVSNGTVFFLYCPFSGERLDRTLSHLEELARVKPLRVCCVGLELERPWLAQVVPPSDGLVVYRTEIAR
jgi:hypothetical protein